MPHDNIPTNNEKTDRKKSAAERKDVATHTMQLLAIARSFKTDLFVSVDGEPFITVKDTHSKTFPIYGSGFSYWLIHQYNKCGKSCGDNPRKQALDVLAAEAFQGDVTRQVFVRVGQLDGRIYIDLCDPKSNQAIEVTPDSWKVVDDPPAVFRRTTTMAKLPLPQHGGDIWKLGEHINVSDDDLPLIICWLIDALKGHGPYHVLILNGQQGSGKSFTELMLSALIDPQETAELNSLSASKKERDIAIDAFNQFVTPYDNLSGLTMAQSDTLCRIATGAGLRLRKLYSNAEQFCFSGARPLILNGIPDFANAPDLLDRSLICECPTIKEKLSEDEMRRKFAAAHPLLLGALCGLLSKSLGSAKPRTISHRMADSYSIMYRAAREFWAVSKFERSYQAKQDNCLTLGIESCPIAEYLRDFLVHRKATAVQQLKMTPTKMLAALNQYLYENMMMVRSSSLPDSGRKVTECLKRYSAALESLGIHFESGRSNGVRSLSLWITPPKNGGAGASVEPEMDLSQSAKGPSRSWEETLVA